MGKALQAWVALIVINCGTICCLKMHRSGEPHQCIHPIPLQCGDEPEVIAKLTFHPMNYLPGTAKPNPPPPPGYRLKGGGGVTLCPPNTPALTLPQKHSHTPTPATTAFPTARNRPPPTRFHIPCDRSTTTLELPRLPPPPPSSSEALPPPPLRRCSPPRSRR